MRRIDEITVISDPNRTTFTYKCNDGSAIVHGIEGVLFDAPNFNELFALSLQAARDSARDE